MQHLAYRREIESRYRLHSSLADESRAMLIGMPWWQRVTIGRREREQLAVHSAVADALRGVLGKNNKVSGPEPAAKGTP